jgi:2-polyprenyl-6-hydroxyphenyl methylase/3-demethylubiquinone-9 3-methyltransferase
MSPHDAAVASRFDHLQARFKSSVSSADFRLQALIQTLSPEPGMLILDLGCGKGRFARELQRLGARVVGVDLSLGMLKEARGIERVRALAHRLPLAPGAFDAIIAVEVFEHLEPRAQPTVLSELRRILKPGGKLAILDKNVACLNDRRPWLPGVAVKWIDERRGRWMYPAGGPVRERWFWPPRLRDQLRTHFDEVVIHRLLSPAETNSVVFRVAPTTRLMTMWLASARSCAHV